MFSPIYKFTITRTDGTEDDLTDVAHLIEVEDYATDSIGRFKFEVYNPNEDYTGVWQPKNIVRYYKDYSTVATTLRFRGRVERVEYKEGKVVVSGRHDILQGMEIVVNKTYTNQEVSSILTDLVTTYLSGFTVTNVQTTTVSKTITWADKPFWDCVQELCDNTGYECYVDSSLDFRFFPSGSVTNSTDAIVHESNLDSVEGFTTNDSTLVRNRVRVYGGEVDGIRPFATSEDSTSQSDNFERIEIIQDDSITSYSEAKALADAILEQKKNAPQVGQVKSTIILGTIQPGENLRLSSPLDNLPPTYYFTKGYKDTIDLNALELSTTVYVNKEPRKISDVLSSIIRRDSSQQNTSVNPNDMDSSYDFTFDTDSGTHSNTQITSSVLKLTSGSTTGSWTSPSRIETNNITQVYILSTGQTLTGVLFDVSTDGGNSYQTVGLKTLTTLTNQGQALVIRVRITDTSAQVESLSVQVKY